MAFPAGLAWWREDSGLNVEVRRGECTTGEQGIGVIEIHYGIDSEGDVIVAPREPAGL